MNEGKSREIRAAAITHRRQTELAKENFLRSTLLFY